jgi:hypothetical protein
MFSTHSHTNIKPDAIVEVLKKDFFSIAFFGLHGGSFWVFLEIYSQGALGIKNIQIKSVYLEFEVL